MTRALLYARFSSELQDARSIDDQIKDLRDYAAKKGWTVAGAHTDAAISGATMLRPGLQALLAAAAAGAGEIVLAEALDRISRDLGDTAQIFKRLSFHQVRLHTLAEGDVAKMHVALKGLMNDEFLAALAAKIRRGMRGNIERGLAAAGIAYGYEKVHELDERGEAKRGLRRIHEDQAAVVRRIFSEYAAGVGPRAICRQLNAEGVPPPGFPRTTLWHFASIIGNKARGIGILHNELYVGRLTFNRTRKVKDPATGRELIRVNPRSEWQHARVPHLAIVDDATWEKVQRLKGLRTPETAPATKRRAPTFLNGRVFCGRCGQPFKARDKARMVCAAFLVRGGCDNNRRVRKVELEAAVLAEIQKLLARPRSYAAAVKRYHESRQQDEADRQRRKRALTKDLIEVRGRSARLVAALAEGTGAAPAAVLRQIAELEAREKDIIARLAQDPAPAVTIHPKAHELYAAKVGALAAAIGPAAAPAVQARAQELLRGLIERIDIIPTAQKPNRPGYRWELSGKLRKFLTLATEDEDPTEGGGGGENGEGTRWGSKMVRVVRVMR